MTGLSRPIAGGLLLLPPLWTKGEGNIVRRAFASGQPTSLPRPDLVFEHPVPERCYHHRIDNEICYQLLKYRPNPTDRSRSDLPDLRYQSTGWAHQSGTG